MGWLREGLSEPGHGPAKHSSFIPPLITQRENRENMVNVNTMAISVTKIQTNLAFCSPNPGSCTHPSSFHILFYPNSLPFFTFSTIPVPLSALDNLSTKEGQPPNSPVPPFPNRRILDSWDPVALSHRPLEILPPPVLQLCWNASITPGDGPSFPLLSRTAPLRTSISSPSS